MRELAGFILILGILKGTVAYKEFRDHKPDAEPLSMMVAAGSAPGQYIYLSENHELVLFRISPDFAITTEPYMPANAAEERSLRQRLGAIRDQHRS